MNLLTHLGSVIISLAPHLIYFFFVFLVGAGVFGLVWALLKISDVNQSYALFCLYGADGFGVITLFLSFIMLCVRAPRSSYNDDEIAMLQR